MSNSLEDMTMGPLQGSGASLRGPDGERDATCALKRQPTIGRQSPWLYIFQYIGIAIAKINLRHSMLAGLSRSLNLPKGF